MDPSSANEKGRETTRSLPTLIVVDDDAAVRHSLKFSMEMDGFAVWLYADAREVLDEPNLPTYGCLLIDYYLPDLDGLQLLATLRSRGVVLPAFLVTGHPSFALRRRVEQAGIRLLEKPLIGNGLEDMIRNSLEQDRDGQ